MQADGNRDRVSTLPKPLHDVFARLGAAALWVGVWAAFGPLSKHLVWIGGIAAGAFYFAFALLVVAGALAAVRAPQILAAVLPVVRRFPIRSAILAINLSFSTLLVLFVGRHVGAICVLCIASTVAVAFVSVSPTRSARTLGETVRFSPISFLILYAALLGGEIHLRYRPASGGGHGRGNAALHREYAPLYSLNAHGLRGPAFSPTPDAETFRILAVGDSFTFGQGVEESATYPARLAARLNAAADDARFEVINCGKSGVDTAWESAWLIETGLGFEPHLVLVQFYHNDIVLTHVRGVYDRLPQFLRRSRALFFLRDRLSALWPAADRSDARWRRAQVVAVDDPPWRRVTQAWSALAATARRTGVPIVAILFPHPGPPHEATRFIHDALSAHCRSEGLHVIDLTDAFESFDPSEQLLSPMDHHPSARMYAIAAERIRDELLHARLLPTPTK